MRTYWVDGAGVTVGNGSESLPFKYSQLVNYFNPDLGDSCGIEPAADDVLNIYNNISFISTNTFISIKRNLNGKITLKAPTAISNPWIVDTAGNLSTEMYFLKNVAGYRISDLEIRDFIVCQNNPGNVLLEMTEITADILTNIVFKNMGAFTSKDLSISVNENVVVKYYGINFNSKNLYL